MRFPRALTTTLAAAALTVGLVATAPAAQAAPPTVAPSAAAQHVAAPAAAAEKAAKARTKIKVGAPTKVKAGKDFVVTAKLTRRSGGTYKPYAKKKLLLVLLPSPDLQYGGVVMTKSTSRKGTVRFALDTSAPELAGKTLDFLVAYEGGSRAKGAESKVVTVSIRK